MLLAQLGEDHEYHEYVTCGAEVAEAHSVSGPSAAVQEAPSVAVSKEDVLPTELVLSLAAYCSRVGVAPGEAILT